MKKIDFKSLTKLEYTRNEQFNSLSVNVKFSGKNVKVVAITSCSENEGKSFVTMNLTRKYAEDGLKVLLIDTDLRKTRLIRDYNVQGVDEIKGLSHYLSGQAEIDDVIYDTNVPNMHIIFAGRSVPKPIALLDSERFDALLEEARKKYDMVLIDTPPLLPVIDTAVIAPKCDGTMIVVNYGNTRRRDLTETKKQLEVSGAKILGTILNQVPLGANKYSYLYYRGYSRYLSYGYRRYSKYGYGRYGYGRYGKGYGYGRRGYGSSYGSSYGQVGYGNTYGNTNDTKK